MLPSVPFFPLLFECAKASERHQSNDRRSVFTVVLKTDFMAVSKLSALATFFTAPIP